MRMPLGRSIRQAAGIARSLRIYYGDTARRRQMAELYRGFVAPGDLVFDIGAHVGDRIAAFLSLGAHVVAVEPQPAAFRWLKLRFGRDQRVSLVQAAVSDKPGEMALHVNLANPTITTASEAFMSAARNASGWEGQEWDDRVSVTALTLDKLIAAHGAPSFAKIDVEGFELNVLNGLSEPLPALSFEFTTIQRGLACDCVDRLSALGPYRFNAALGESQQLHFHDAVDADEIRAYLNALPHNANSGDIYAQLSRQH